MKSVILCSGQPIMVAGFASVIETSGEFSVSVCPDSGLLGERLRAEGVDILVADTANGFNLSALRELRTAAPATAIILWVDAVYPEFIQQVLGLGISGVLRKNSGLAQCLQCIRQVAAGAHWVEDEILNQLFRTQSVRLTPRERQLIGMLTQGLRNKEIAYRLGISEATVKVYLSRLYEKLGVNDRFELAIFGLKNLAADRSSASQASALSVGLSGTLPFIPAVLSIGPRAACQ